MKNIFLKTVLICFFGILAAGCDNLVAPGKSEPADSAGKGLVRIYIGEPNTGNARTLQPASTGLEGYRLTFSGTAAHDPVNISSGNYADVYLANGTYTITAKAYKKDGIIGNEGDEAAAGSIVGVVLAGGVVTSNGGVIPPIILAPSGSGDGALHYQITPGASLQAGSHMTLYQLDGINKITGFASDGTLTISAAGATGDYTITKGRYIVEIKLVNASDEVAYYRDVVEIWSGVTTDLIFDPQNYTDPGLGLAYSGAALSETLTTFDDIAIGAGSGTGDSELDPKTYSIEVSDIEDVTVTLTPDNDSLFADISWAANTGTAPGDDGYVDTTLPADFSQGNVLWVKMVSEDTTATAYYQFIVCPSLPTDLTFTDEDREYGEIGGTMSWTKPDVLTGISGYRIYFGSDETTPIGDALYDINDLDTESQTIADDTEVPPGTEYLIIVNYDAQGDDYPVFAAIPFIDEYDGMPYGDFLVKSLDYSSVSYASNTLTIAGSGDYEITMNGVSSTSDRITITSGTVNITITDVNIDVSAIVGSQFPDGRTIGVRAFNISGATVNLTVKGDNNFTSGNMMAGIRVASNASLTITGESDGALTARGGNGAHGASPAYSTSYASGGGTGFGGGAGIGGDGGIGNSGENSGTITILAGTITAYGGNGGNGGTGADHSANGGGGGGGGGGGAAGIGGGGGAAAGGISVGGGRGGNPAYAVSGNSGANGGDGTVTIAGGASVSATGGAGGAQGNAGTGGKGNATAGGNGGRGGNIGGGGGAGGGGHGANGNALDHNIVVDNSVGGNGGACNGIQGANAVGYYGGGGREFYDYTGGTEYGDFYVKGDTSVSYSSKNLSITGSGNYEITMKSTVSSTSEDRITVTSGTANITIASVNIDVSASAVNAFSISSGATVNLTVKGANSFASGPSLAGIRVPNGASLTITAESNGALVTRGGNGADGSNGRLSFGTTTGGSSGGGGGAGIGGNGGRAGNSADSSGTIAILADNTVIAYGGNGGNGGMGANNTDGGGSGGGGGGAGGAGIGGGGGGSGISSSVGTGGGGGTSSNGRGQQGGGGAYGGNGTIVITSGLVISATGGTGGYGGPNGSGGQLAKAGGNGGKGGDIGGGGGSGGGGCGANTYAYGPTPPPDDWGDGGTGGSYNGTPGATGSGYHGGAGAQR